MKLCSDMVATDLDGLSCEIHSRTGIHNLAKGAVKVVLMGEHGVNVFAFEQRVDGPLLWKATFTGDTPAVIVMEVIKGAVSEAFMFPAGVRA